MSKALIIVLIYFIPIISFAKDSNKKIIFSYYLVENNSSSVPHQESLIIYNDGSGKLKTSNLKEGLACSNKAGEFIFKLKKNNFNFIQKKLQKEYRTILKVKKENTQPLSNHTSYSLQAEYWNGSRLMLRSYGSSDGKSIKDIIRYIKLKMKSSLFPTKAVKLIYFNKKNGAISLGLGSIGNNSVLTSLPLDSVEGAIEVNGVPAKYALKQKQSIVNIKAKTLFKFKLKMPKPKETDLEVSYSNFSTVKNEAFELMPYYLCLSPN